MNPEKVKAEIAVLLGDPERNFDLEPISTREGHELLDQLMSLVADQSISDETAASYMCLYEMIKDAVFLQ